MRGAYRRERWLRPANRLFGSGGRSLASPGSPLLTDTRDSADGGHRHLPGGGQTVTDSERAL